ncbi:class I SAM-dependent methyltransferase [Dyella monticola]|uniref:Class I SAM-dependent methyltransferase n=1 Tax=Dyella monticola TaxID=1927958 RepID=A0A370WUN0_9GAMM|nr:class I SAM-dependent methyltransferase [Dyella monticola]RDS79736.1 class I SAM-dependent methyltransferase [Dyella monticola]
MTDLQRHWDQVYASKAVDAVSWYQPHPETSLALIADSRLDADAPLIDIGAGASTLVDHLLDAGYRDVTVLDIAAQALTHAQTRLGPAKARQVRWITADVTQFAPSRTYALWHDRAVFHFLTHATARDAYLATLRRSLVAGGTAIIATFAADGPMRCSGLDVARYDADALFACVGDGFEPLATARDMHVTPWGARQAFTYVRMRRSM